MTPKEEMQEAYNFWVYHWWIFHHAKHGNIDYSKMSRKFNLQDERRIVTFEIKEAYSPIETEQFAKNTVIAMTGAVFTILNSAMDTIFDPKEKNEAVQTTGLIAARIIVFQIRNAYAHNPINPKWHITNSCHLKMFGIPEINITVDFKKLNEKDLKFSHINGVTGLTELLKYCLASVKDG